MKSNPHRQYPLLAPFAVLYGIGSRWRNYLFDTGLKKSYFSSIPTICIGNFAVGGTGKTPMIEFLIRHLSAEYRIAVISRGYKRKTRGLVVATDSSTSRDIGDEPFQIKRKFPFVDFVVSANRKKALLYLEGLPSSERPTLILLDDGFQHRAIKPFLSIILTAYHSPYFEDKLLPQGRLRESMASLHRVQAVVVTKCPSSLSFIERKLYAKKLGLFENQSSFFSFIDYGQPYPLFGKGKLKGNERVILLAGLADNSPFFQQARGLFPHPISEKSLTDHYQYTLADLKKMEKELREEGGEAILMTEKDAVKIIALKEGCPLFLKQRLFYLPIATSLFKEDEETFLAFVRDSIRQYPHRETFLLQE